MSDFPLAVTNANDRYLLMPMFSEASQMVEDRKIYVRRVSSNVCDLKRASRTPMTSVLHCQQQQQQQPRDQRTIQTGGLYETFLEVALYYDRNSQRHTPYVKSSYPNQVRLLVS